MPVWQLTLLEYCAARIKSWKWIRLHAANISSIKSNQMIGIQDWSVSSTEDTLTKNQMCQIKVLSWRGHSCERELPLALKKLIKYVFSNYYTYPSSPWIGHTWCFGSRSLRNGRVSQPTSIWWIVMTFCTNTQLSADESGSVPDFHRGWHLWLRGKCLKQLDVLAFYCNIRVSFWLEQNIGAESRICGN